MIRSGTGYRPIWRPSDEICELHRFLVRYWTDQARRSLFLLSEPSRACSQNACIRASAECWLWMWKADNRSFSKYCLSHIASASFHIFISIMRYSTSNIVQNSHIHWNLKKSQYKSSNRWFLALQLSWSDFMYYHITCISDLSYPSRLNQHRYEISDHFERD
jgi:hypothetical protein